MSVPVFFKALSATAGLTAMGIMAKWNKGEIKGQGTGTEMIKNGEQRVEPEDHSQEDISSLSHLILEESSVVGPNEKGLQQQQAERLKRAVTVTKDKVHSKMTESGCPGVAISVAVNGKTVFKSGFGYSDVENRTLVTPNTVMRVASISKAITAAAVGRLVEEGKLDLDRPVSDLVESWPKDKPKITTRQLLCHMSGIRHYDTKEEIERKKRETDEKSNKSDIRGDGRFKEFHLNKRFDSVKEALEIFKHDELLCQPGEAFNYTTHGFTLLSAVVESAAGESFEKRMRRTFQELGMNNTNLDENEPIIYNRARYYIRDKHHDLKNAANVDNSCKWAGGGFVSNVGDLARFGNAMLYSFQYNGAGTNSNSKPVKSNPVRDVVYNPGPFAAVNQSVAQESKEKGRSMVQAKRGPLPGYLKRETMRDLLWQPLVRMAKEEALSDAKYAQGWMTLPRVKERAFARDQRFFAFHTGGAVGASSVLLIMPSESLSPESPLPQGVVVAILTNMEGVGLTKLAKEVAKEFEGIQTEGPYRVQRVYQC